MAKRKLKNYGFVPEPIKKRNKEDYVLGGKTKILGKIFQPDMNWKPHLPDAEHQANGKLEKLKEKVNIYMMHFLKNI